MIQPNIPKPIVTTKVCARCGRALSSDEFAPNHSPFFGDKRYPFCNDCANVYLQKYNYEWNAVDKLCQFGNIPFIVKEWTKLVALNGQENTWPVYAQVFAGREYDTVGWGDYNAQYQKLREAGLIEDEIPLLNEQKVRELHDKWGSNYQDEDLYYLEDLYKGLMNSQNINGALQIDQAKKICKFSLAIDQKIREGDKDVDKFLSSYDKLVKTAEFTPKNVKNAVDFDSFAEVAKWLEKRGRQNRYYDGVTRDVIDETLKNIESYNQRLYINEGGIGDEITQRLKQLEGANKMEETGFYDLQKEFDLDEYENQAFTGDADDFSPEGDDNEQ